MNLLDSYELRGTDFEEFQKGLNEITDSTFTVKVKSNEISLLHFETEEKDRLIFTMFGKNAPQKVSIRKVYFHEEFLHELSTTRLLLRLNGAGPQPNDLYLAAGFLSRDLAARAELMGRAIADPTAERDAYIISRYQKCPRELTAVIRRDDPFQKIVALASDQYGYVSQKTILEFRDTLDDLVGERSKCFGWEITPRYTRLLVSYPKKAEDISEIYKLPETLTPCVLFETSDTGDCSITATAVWKTAKNSFSRISEFSREHRLNAKFNLGKKMTDVILSAYTKVPNRLAELLTIRLNDPESALDTIFKKMKMAEKFGKKRSMNLLECMKTLVSSRTSMSAYEIAMMFMNLTSLFDFGGKNVKIAAEEIAGAVPFFKFEELAEEDYTVIPA